MTVPKRYQAKRVRVLVKRNKDRAGYSFWLKGVRIDRWWHNLPWIDRKMGPKRQAQWWSASYDPKTFILRMIQPLVTPVEEKDLERPNKDP